MTPRQPTSVSFTPAHVAYLDALAAHQGRSRSRLIERLLERVPAPTELTDTARRCREAKKALDDAVGAPNT